MTDEKTIYSISGVGKCMRTVSLDALGLIQKEAPNEKLRLAAREGMRHERWIREDLKEHGWKSLTAAMPPRCNDCGRDGYHVEFDKLEDVKFIGHMDDLVIPAARGLRILHLAEYKSLGKYTSGQLIKNGLDFHRGYSYQVSLYHYATDLPILYVVKSRDSGEMEVFEYDPRDMEEIAEFIYTLQGHIKAGEIAPCSYSPPYIDKWSCTDFCKTNKSSVISAKQVESL